MDSVFFVCLCFNVAWKVPTKNVLVYGAGAKATTGEIVQLKKPFVPAVAKRDIFSQSASVRNTSPQIVYEGEEDEGVEIPFLREIGSGLHRWE